MNDFQSDDIFDVYKSNALTLFALAGEALQGFGKLAELNLQVGRAILAESGEGLQQMTPGTSRMDWLAFPSHFAQSAGGKALSYQRHIGDIAASTRSGWMKIATAHHEQLSRDMQARIDHWVRHAPVGSQAAAIALKSALSTASRAAEATRKSVQGAIEMAQRNVSVLATPASGQAVLQAGGRTEKKD
ncbi:MAG TPA: TIGR01841 family phasin [Paraburkholderia sp.]|uniref:TIGR01841 family phasin n=1 Tax=Paraburkholderia sp. TaxID=1926495 RepID=UPI002B497F10|nr:TIGR01841 family phasin [Paraburkholderia sp.]HKR39596.1 TIGR01841 family phasin [Paraburkholderia sp.]